MDTTRTEVSRVQTRTTGPLIKDHQLFALFKTPNRRRQRAHVKRLCCDVKQVVQNAADLAIQYANKARTAWHFHTCQLFNSQTPSVLLVHRADIIKAVKVRQVLQIGPALHELFRATVQKPDMRITALHNLTVQLQNKPQNAVRGRVLRTKVQVKVANFLLARLGVVKARAVHHFAPSPFSSPGRM